MVISAILFFIAGVYSLAKPLEALSKLTLAPTDNVQWLFMFMGVLMIALSINQGTTSRNAADPTFRSVAVLSILIEGAMAGIIYLGPGELSRVRWILIGICLFIGLLYIITLPIKSMGYKEENPPTSH